MSQVFSSARFALIASLCALSLIPSVAVAGGLDDYKKQKHAPKDRKKVTKNSCQKDYIDRCARTECSAQDTSCRKQCVARAPQFCEARQKRRRRKQAGVVAKGASVVAGGALVLGARAVENKFGKEVPAQANDYTVFWKSPSLDVSLGAGYLFAGVFQGAATAQVRYKWFGVGGQFNYLDDLSTNLIEAEAGPIFYIASPAFGLTFGAQPSLLVSGAADVSTLYGAGLRSYTTLYLDRLMVSFDPMLGYINRQWNYHVRLSGAYRVTPRVYLKLAYDYRDILDLNDLDISQSRLQGLVGSVGFRFN